MKPDVRNKCFWPVNLPDSALVWDLAGYIEFAIFTPFGLMPRSCPDVADRLWGIDMANASIEVSGPNAERLAGELRAALVTAIQPGDSVSPVEVERSADLLIAIIGLAFSGVGTAKTIWDWWHARQPQGVKVRILLDDGTQVELSGMDQEQLEIALARTPPGH